MLSLIAEELDQRSKDLCRGDPVIDHTQQRLMLVAAFASVVIASCYDDDTCTTTTGEQVRLACIDTPELTGKRAEPVQQELLEII